MPDRRPIMILSASAGAGHMVAAEALREALSALDPLLPVEVHDLLAWTNGMFRGLYAQGYLGLVNHVPAAMGMLYDALDRPGPLCRDASRRWFQNINTQRAVVRLRQADPRLIINTHFLPAEIVAEQRHRGRLHCPQVTVTTDYETHRLWVQQPTERYFCACELGRAGLESWGVPADAIEVAGIPVRAAFTRPPSRESARAGHGLVQDRPVVLLSCGAFGVAGSEDIFRELLKLPAGVQCVVICGRNERLRQRLADMLPADRTGVRLLGFTDEMESWMAAADVLVTKPGGLTTSEALACSLPMVLVHPIPGQEQRNADYLLEQGVAIKVNNCRVLAHRVQTLLSDSARLAALRAAAGRLAQPGAARRIAESVIRLLDADAFSVDCRDRRRE